MPVIDSVQVDWTLRAASIRDFGFGPGVLDHRLDCRRT